jgi:hypothetical protein
MAFNVLRVSRPRKLQRSLAFVLKRIWSDPVGSAVISAGILALLGALATYFLGYWEKIKNAFIWLFVFFSQGVTIPLWLMVISIPALLAAIPVLLRLLPDRRPRFTRYVQDSFWGIDWYWNWASRNRNYPKYYVTDLHARCPECKSLLDARFSRHPTCLTPTCRWKWSRQSLPGTPPSDYAELLNRALREIDRRVHTDEFRV